MAQNVLGSQSSDPGIVKAQTGTVDFFTMYNFEKGMVLGSGMSGEVLLAKNKDDPTDTRAVKIFSKGDRDKLWRMFMNESGILQMLDHAHVMGGTQVSASHFLTNFN